MTLEFSETTIVILSSHRENNLGFVYFFASKYITRARFVFFSF